MSGNFPRAVGKTASQIGPLAIWQFGSLALLNRHKSLKSNRLICGPHTAKRSCHLAEWQAALPPPFRSLHRPRPVNMPGQANS
jgi:hypothetical protein